MSWNGPKEKKWEWYKHTKPCYNMIYLKSCNNTNCNYAHSVDQYVNAILKRSFDLDFNIINQLKLVDTNTSTMKIVETVKEWENNLEEPNAKRRRTN